MEGERRRWKGMEASHLVCRQEGSGSLFVGFRLHREQPHRVHRVQKPWMGRAKQAFKPGQGCSDHWLGPLSRGAAFLACVRSPTLPAGDADEAEVVLGGC